MNPRVVSILREDYAIPFKMKLPLTRSPLIVSGYADSVKNRFLKEALLTHIKVGSGKSSCPVIPSLLQPVIPGAQTKQQMETHSRSTLNLYLNPGSFKMESSCL